MFYKRLRATVSTLPALLLCMMMALQLSCSSDNATHSDRMKILDTYADVIVASSNKAIASRAINSVEAELRAIDHIGYTITEHCELQQLNEAFEFGKAYEASDELIELVQKAKSLSALSKGLFNPAAGELTALWQTRCETKNCTVAPYPDDVMKLVNVKVSSILKSKPRMSDIIIDGNFISSRNSEVKLEFGDLIRGFALDKGINHLKSQSIENAMIDIGESAHVIGRKGKHPWWVGLHDVSGEHLLGTIELADDNAVVTARAISKIGGKQSTVFRYAVDPRTGLPARGIASVTVLHSSAAVANVAASSLLISGRKNWKQIADRFGVKALIMFDDDGTIYMSPAMSEIIHWKQRLPHTLLVP
jgi:thiamine biosynthesis lipoprotein